VGQLIPAGVLVTDPSPSTSTFRDCVICVNVAVTDVAAFIVTVQVLCPEQPPPDQPVKL
jgi:hypothetical protein